MCQKPVIGAIGLGGESVFLSVDHFHAPGETLQAENIFVEPGGKAYNQAVAARRLGAQVRFFGAMGADKGGDFCREYLIREGVEPIIEVIPDATTAYACILTDRAGENRVTVSRGASQKLTAAFLRSQERAIQSCTHMLLGLECPLEATGAARELCQKHGVFTILNPAPAIPLPLDFLLGFDLITPNLQEATVLLGLSGQPEPTELAHHLRKAGFPRAVVTLGSRGCLLLDGKDTLLYPALPVKAVDTTGAGDTFNAALAVALSRGKSLRDAVVYATNASAYSVQRPHVMDALPTAEALAQNGVSIAPTFLLQKYLGSQDGI